MTSATPAASTSSQPGYASTIEQHKIFLTAGHDEYWTGQQRANVTAARDAGVNMAFFTGNEVFWKTRLEPSIDGSNTPNRTLVAYKETHYDAPVDPQDPPTWTGTWMDPRFSPPGDGGQPAERADRAVVRRQLPVPPTSQVPAFYSKLRFWRNTRVASLASGQSTTLDQGVGTLGYEWDVDADNGFRPAGLMDMSSTTVPTRGDLHRLREHDHTPAERHRHPPPDAVPGRERRPGVRRRDRAMGVGPGQRDRVRNAAAPPIWPCSRPR